MMTLFAKVNLIMNAEEGHDYDVCQSELDCDHRGRPS
jgi:hypothetical protein